MVGIAKMKRNLAGSIGNVVASLFGNLFAWLWFGTLLIVFGLITIFATPIKMVGDGGPSLTVVLATAGGMLLFAAGGAFAWHRLGEERAVKLGGLLLSLIVPAAIVVVAGLLWWAWDVPDIWHRPLATLTLSDIGQNVLKLLVLFCGLFFVSAVVRRIFSKL